MKDLLTVGRPMIDCYTEIPTDVLKSCNLQIGCVNFVGNGKIAEVLKILDDKKQIYFGGTEANTAIATATLGLKPNFFGCRGDDLNGILFEEDLKRAGVNTHFQLSTKNTPYVVTIKHPSLDTSTKLIDYASSEDLIFDEDLKFLIESNNFFNTSLYSFLASKYDTMFEVMRYASLYSTTTLNFGGSIAIRDRSRIKDILDLTSIVFSNEKEAKTFAETDSVYDALNYLAEHVKIAIVTLADQGSLIKTKDKTIKISAIPVKVVNEIGPGDAYAGGFLYALIKGKNIEEAGELATKIASYKVSTNFIRVYELPYHVM